MLHTAVLRSPHAHARVARIDLAPALAAPGVHAAIGPGELDALVEECGYEGAAVAAVCADTRAQARAAVSAIEVEWEVLEPLLDPDEAVARGELLGEPRERERGDVEHGLAEADVVVTGEYRTQTVLHNSLETHRRSCRGSATRSRSTSRRSTSGASATRSRSSLGMPADKVRVVCEYMGGGFGSKTDAGDYTFIATELATRTDRPVRCTLTRREENVSSGNRNATIQRLTIGARSDGTLTALGGDYVNAVGWFGWSSPVEGPMQMLYACPNVKTTTSGAKLNHPPMQAFRAPGFVEGTFGLECLLDELAAKLDLDPLELRRRNYADTTQPTTGRTAARTCSSATAAPSRTGSAGTRCALARRRPSSAASAWRRRSGTAAAARRATRGCASAPTDARPSSLRCRTSARGHALRSRRSRPRSSASRSST